MAYNALNNLIDAYIYANGVQAITGQILNGVLKQMVAQLGSGYHLMGVAGPETVPASNDYAMAYFAATAGEYTAFGGITLAAGEVAVLLTSGNGSWGKQVICIVPLTTEDLENTSGFITDTVSDLVNYYSKPEIDSLISSLNRLAYIVAWDGESVPIVGDIPAGVAVNYGGNVYTGTLDASADTMNKIYMVWDGSNYDMYGTVQGDSYSWIPMGTTAIDMSQFATDEDIEGLNKQITDLEVQLFGGSIDLFERYPWQYGTYYDEVVPQIDSRKYTVIPCKDGDSFIMDFNGSTSWGFYVYFADENGVISYRQVYEDTTLTIGPMDGGRIPTEMRITVYPSPDQIITPELWETFNVSLTSTDQGVVIQLEQEINDIDLGSITDEETSRTVSVSPTWIMGYLAPDTGAIMAYTGDYYYSSPFRLSKGSVIEFTATGQGVSIIALYSDAAGTECIRTVNNVSDGAPHKYTTVLEEDCFVRLCCNNKNTCIINVQKVITIYSDLSRLTKLKVAEWNFGLFNNGVLPFGVPDDQVNIAIANLKELLISLDADILIATEYSEFINRSQTVNTYDALLAQFFPYMYLGGNYMGVFSKVPFDVSSVISPDGRNMELGILTAYRGRVGFGVIHPRSAEGQAAEDARIADHQAVIDYFEDYETVIVGGDFNTYEDRELDVYRENGWVLGNCGYFGNIDTYMPSQRDWYIDNVVTKGININNFKKIDSRAGVSDHYPVVAEVSFWL